MNNDQLPASRGGLVILSVIVHRTFKDLLDER